jgi:hypothetical protein
LAPKVVPTANAGQPIGAKVIADRQPSLLDLAAAALHGTFFVALAIAGVLYFGLGFGAVALLMLPPAVMSLHDAWRGFRLWRLQR